MPNITVEHSPVLDHVDWRAFALALHPMLVETAAAKIEACKTRTLRIGDEVVGMEAEPGVHAIVHVSITLLAGRSDETKAKLTEATVELLRKHIPPIDGVTLHLSAEARDLGPSYRRHVQ